MVVSAAVAAAGAAAVAANGIGFGGGDSAGKGTTGLPPATAQVTRQTLVDTKSASGELGYGNTTKVPGRLAGTLTGLPATGATVSRGKALYRVDNAPVVLLYGGLPVYRALSPGTDGADVKQFEQNLRALGYDGFTVDDEYTSSTATAVKQWQEDLGLKETGTVELGRVFYAPTAVRVDSHQVAKGDPIGPGTAVLTYTRSSKVVTVELTFDDRRLAKSKAAVTVELPDGKTVPGKIAGTAIVIKPAEGSEEEDTTIIEVTVTVNDPKTLAGLDQAALDVAFTASERKDVLTVPVAALLALSEGGYGVELVKGDSTSTVAVKTGLFAGGRVEVSGEGVTEGATVGMPA
ncbi:peptidoglycan-binding protein [Actinomadura sp. HBU206391]|nr:peptidoglycan-binding protein [Actinomadura sp. HBU206391]